LQDIESTRRLEVLIEDDYFKALALILHFELADTSREEFEMNAFVSALCHTVAVFR